MQIHEITKLQRTDEGLLGDVKNAISKKATAVYKDTAQSINDKVAAVKNMPTQARQDYIGGVKAAKRSGEDNNLLTRMAGAGNVLTKAGDRWQEKQWDKKQDKRNAQSAKAAQALQRKGFNVDTTTQAAKAPTPTRVKQQKISQLQQAFDQEFDIGYELNPNAAAIHAQQQAARLPQSQLQQTIAAQNKQMSPQSGIKEAQVDPTKLALMKARARTPGVTQPDNAPQKKDIDTDFITWINHQIPGLDKAPPDVKAKLNGIFAQMKTLKGNPKAVDAAFQKYVDLALSAVAGGPQAQHTQGQQAPGGISASAQYAQQGIAHQLGISPDAITKLQQKIQQNGETISNANTGSQTLDTFIQAVKKR